MNSEMESSFIEIDDGSKNIHGKYGFAQLLQKIIQLVKQMQANMDSFRKQSNSVKQQVSTTLKVADIINKIIVIVIDYDSLSQQQLHQQMQHLKNYDLKQLGYIECLSCYLIAKLMFIQQMLNKLAIKQHVNFIEHCKHELTAKVKHELQNYKNIENGFESRFSDIFRKQWSSSQHGKAMQGEKSD